MFDNLLNSLGPFAETFFMIALHIAHSNRITSLASSKFSHPLVDFLGLEAETICLGGPILGITKSEHRVAEDSRYRRRINSEVMMCLLEMLEESVVDGIDVVTGDQEEVEYVGIALRLVRGEKIIIEVDLGKVSKFGLEKLAT
ncbi:hypothetical protein HG530_010232 [Fusarium avenaceum]|nr:hypothetical protein HG530_010232 [Fusarium avenaceum]